MKLNVFLIILGVLLLSCLGSRVQESFDLGQDLANLGGDVAQGIGNVAGGVAHGVGDVVGGTARGVGDIVGGTARGVGDVVGGVGQGIGDVVGGVGGALGLDDLYDMKVVVKGDLVSRKRKSLVDDVAIIVGYYAQR